MLPLPAARLPSRCRAEAPGVRSDLPIDGADVVDSVDDSRPAEPGETRSKPFLNYSFMDRSKVIMLARSCQFVDYSPKAGELILIHHHGWLRFGPHVRHYAPALRRDEEGGDYGFEAVAALASRVVGCNGERPRVLTAPGGEPKVPSSTYQPSRAQRRSTGIHAF